MMFGSSYYGVDFNVFSRFVFSFCNNSKLYRNLASISLS